jgi:hypothetical protein
MLAGLPLEVDLVAAGGFDDAGLYHVDVAVLFATHHEVVLFVGSEPLEVCLAGNSRVHDDERTVGRLELTKHFLQGAAFADVAFEHFRVPDKSTRNDLAVNVLGAFFDGGIDRKQGLLGIENFRNPGAEFRPDFGGEVEIGAPVEQSVLADLLADSSGFDETVGEIGATVAVRSRLGLANEHDQQNDLEIKSRVRYKFQVMALHFNFWKRYY